MKRLLIVLCAILPIIASGQRLKQPKSDTSTMRSLLVRYEIKHVDIVLRQSVWESGWYKCIYCSLKFNNPFGFRLSSKAREGNSQGYLEFDTIEESVAYYKRWQDKYYKGGDYYQFLKNIGYAADNDKYVRHLKSLW